MYYILLSLIFIPIIIIFNSFMVKNKFLLNYHGEKHQKFTSNTDIPLTGGIYIFLYSLFFFQTINSLFAYFLGLFLILGIFSDKKIIESPKIRFVFQLLIVVFFMINFNLDIDDIRIEFFNNLLKNNIFKYFFIISCFLILLNGTNFIDGCNTLVIGYYLNITLIGLYTQIFLNIGISDDLTISLIIFLSIIFLFNFFNKLYLGDNGSYLISIIFGFLLVSIYQNDRFISPYFIVLLFWYPAFETLFSIIRKSLHNISPLKPDTNHLHQIIFLFLKKKYSKNIYINSLTAVIINLYNLCIFFIASQNIFNSKFQILLIILNISIYMISYLILLKNFSNQK